MTPIRRGRGRPTLKDEDRRSEPVGIRLTKELRDWLKAAQRTSGAKSLSGEIERRLRDSFFTEKEIEARFGGPRTAALLERIANRILAIEVTQRHWLNDPYAFHQVRAMLDVVLNHLRPRGRRVIPKPLRRLHPEDMGRRHALELLATLKMAGWASTPKESLPSSLLTASAELRDRIRGSPIVEFDEILRRHSDRLNRDLERQGTTLEVRQREIVSLTKRASTVGTLVTYLKPRLVTGAKMPSMAKIFEGVTGADLIDKKALIIGRIKSAIRSKLIDHPDIDIDANLAVILDDAGMREIGEQHMISGKQHRLLQRRAEEVISSGGRK